MCGESDDKAAAGNTPASAKHKTQREKKEIIQYNKFFGKRGPNGALYE